MMQIIEQFSEGKYGLAEKNEDVIVVTDDFIGVLDGCTSFLGDTINGIPSGRFAAQNVASQIAQLPRDISAVEAVERLNQGLYKAVSAIKNVDDKLSLPATALLLYSKSRQEIWRVADSMFKVDDAPVNDYELAQIPVFIHMRQVMNQAQFALGKTAEALREDDPFAPVLKDFSRDAAALFNYEGKYGFGIINGTKTPKKYIEVHPVRNAGKITFVSDGYLTIGDTLAETEDHLQKVLREDPLMLHQYPQVKSHRTGWKSFDDRSYVSFRP